MTTSNDRRAISDDVSAKLVQLDAKMKADRAKLFSGGDRQAPRHRGNARRR
jgi:hypothetical protein